MKLSIAKKICKYMGHGYPIDNTYRLERAVTIWERACKRLKYWQRNLKY